MNCLPVRLKTSSHSLHESWKPGSRRGAGPQSRSTRENGPKRALVLPSRPRRIQEPHRRSDPTRDPRSLHRGAAAAAKRQLAAQLPALTSHLRARRSSTASARPLALGLDLARDLLGRAPRECLPPPPQRLGRELGLRQRLLRHRRRSLLDRAHAQECQQPGHQDDPDGHDQEREPPVDRRREPGGDRGQAEAEPEHQQHGGRQREADPDAE